MVSATVHQPASEPTMAGQLRADIATVESTTADQTTPPGRTIGFGKHRYPLQLPKLTDPRLHLASVIFSLQILGQTALKFDLSIAQILVSLGTVAIIEFTITFWQHRVVAWPASALLTGNGVAFIFRVPGTEHGDWWSMHGAHLFAATAALSILSKYVITYRGSHIFNPSNLGLVIAFLILGPYLADPQDLWWGPLSPTIIAVIAIIVAGGLLITRRLGLLPITLAFFFSYSAGIGLIAQSGHCMTARWSIDAVCGQRYWTTLVLSPEILVFLFFMITDPRTIPRNKQARIVYGVGIGVLAALLSSLQRTEFATKVAILAALVVVCAFRPMLDALGERRTNRAELGSAPRAFGRPMAGVAVALVVGILGVALLTGSHRTMEDFELAAASAGFSTGSTNQAVGRPAVDIDLTELPKGEIDDSVIKVNSNLGNETATTMLQDLAENLEIVRTALTQRDSTLLDSAVLGQRLIELQTQLATPNGTVTIEDRTITSATLVRLEDPNPQAPPRLAMRITGSMTTTLSSGSPPTTAAGASDKFDESFALRLVGDHYLILELIRN